MLQYMLLVVEVIVLVGITYLHWKTRKRLRQMRACSEGTALESSGDAKTPIQSGPSTRDIDVVHDVADLLAELQSATSAVRDDWVRQEASLQQMLERTDTARAELGDLLEQAAAVSSLNPPISPETKECDVYEAAPSEVCQEASPSLSLADAVDAFGEHLLAEGRSEGAVKRTIGYVREFAAWLGGQRYNGLLLNRIDLAQIEAYLDYLKAQDYKLNTVKRKAAALKSFRNWTNTLVSGIQPNGGTAAYGTHLQPPVVQDEAMIPMWQYYAGTLAGTDRRQTVLALAEQGLDRPTIAARTGLEQETVRLFLSRRKELIS